MTEIVILWVNYTIQLGFSLIWHFFGQLRITDEGSVPEMRICSILLIKPDMKYCIQLSKSLFACLNDKNHKSV